LTQARKVRPKPSTSEQKKPVASRKPGPDFWICFGLLIAIFAVYGQVRTYSFVSYDDPIYVAENPHVRAGLSWDGVVWAFTTFHDANWFPLTWLSHMLDCQFFGLDSGWHHLTNVWIHALSTLLLFAVLKRMTGARWRSAMVALLFAVHPLHVESVAWVAERKDVLSGFFWMLTLWLYTRYADEPSPLRYSLTLLAFCLGLMAKPMLVTLPVVLLLLDYWPLKRGLRIAEKIPFFVASLAASVVTYVAHQRGGAVAAFDVVPLLVRTENALIAYVTYVVKMFWPTHLAAFYPFSLEPILLPAAFAGVAMAVVTVLVLRAVPRRPYLAVGWFWYVVTLAPVIGLIQTGSQSRADRYTYIPMIGLTIALVWGISEVLEPWPQIRVALAAAVGVACLALTWFQVQTWRDDISLYQHAIDVVPDNYVARYNLAAVLETEGRTDEAVGQLREAVRVRPYYTPARAELGQLLATQGHLDEALRELQTAVKQRPDDAVARFRLGSVLGNLGHSGEAADQFSQAVRLQPENADARFNLGLALAQEGQLQEAVREFNATVRLRPDDAVARFNLGIALARLGRMDESIVQFSEAVRLKPDFIEARQALDRAMTLGQSREKE
jgi:tetratricopeptide (TPR) repeat protein